MKIKCAYSGLNLEVSHFPAFLESPSTVHPIFNIPQKKLIQYLRKWGNGELTPTDSYLLYLALFNSTDLIEFRTNAVCTTKTNSIVSANLEQLTRVISYSNTILHPSFVLPKIVIDKDTCTLENSPEWIKLWTHEYNNFQSGYLKDKEREAIKKREFILQTFIKDVNKPISHYAKIIADWASEVGEFPQFFVTIDGQSIRLSEYWKGIIIKCCKSEAIFSIPTADLMELIEHCEENIEHGSIYSHTLMELLRAGMSRQKNYLGLGDLDLSLTTYSIIDANTSIEDANRKAMIDSAPLEMPLPGMYPSKLAYMVAKSKWEMALEYKKQMEAVEAIKVNSESILTDDGKLL